MKKLFIPCLTALALLATLSGCAQAQQKSISKSAAKSALKSEAKGDKNDDNNGWYSNGNHAPGTWDAIVEDGQVNIQFYGHRWNSGRNFPKSELGTLPDGKIGEFILTREAGKMTFKGVFEGRFGHGAYNFVENADFKSYLAQRGYKELDDQLMLDVFFTDINKGYFDFLKDNGYADISNDQFRDLARQDLNRKKLTEYFDLFNAEKYGHQSLEKIVELREHGVSAKFINGFHEMGYKNIPLDQALELRDHGVSPQFITEFKKMGYADISLEKATGLRDHGVNPKYIASMQEMGYKNLTLDKAQDLRDHGVSSEFFRKMHDAGYKDISLDK
ncbi:MAG: hypothetical protein ABIN13_04715, partial [Mucilaginibacter sp.]